MAISLSNQTVCFLAVCLIILAIITCPDEDSFVSFIKKEVENENGHIASALSGAALWLSMRSNYNNVKLIVGKPFELKNFYVFATVKFKSDQNHEALNNQLLNWIYSERNEKSCYFIGAFSSWASFCDGTFEDSLPDCSNLNNCNNRVLKVTCIILAQFPRVHSIMQKHAFASAISSIIHNRLYTLITSCFVSSSLVKCLYDLYNFYYYAPNVYQQIGSQNFVIFFLASAAFTSFVSVLNKYHQNNVYHKVSGMLGVNTALSTLYFLISLRWTQGPLQSILVLISRQAVFDVCFLQDNADPFLFFGGLITAFLAYRFFFFQI
ncbi:hypothetical protein ROZALSC1DRAFT_20913 [Rozella allomycis CSF55]|uniref:Peptidase S54 rhomboid domain-containing protein n=1 Tax=Rozella allomycis (strain CSF55) TaxID=988480 RepID=A0A4P9YN31_ROZAC|nr:hypothetical protein ROZALSC1DRAFT_20913 [Rozella allomycis CSF55]